jgi:ribosome modulation factor
MPSKEDIIAEAHANWARQRAQLHQERKEAGLSTVILKPADDEPPLLSTEYQTEFIELKKMLHENGVEAEAPFIVMDSVGGGGGYIGELLIPIAQVAGPIVAASLVAWLQGRAARKVRVRFGDIEIEAPTKEAMTNEEFETLLRRTIQARSGEDKGTVSDTVGKKTRPRPKLMSKAEQAVLSQQREAMRLGRVAHHHGKSAEACPYAETDPLRPLWLEGLAEAKKRKLRLDMTAARAKGFNAFKDGLRPEECPLPARSPERSEWMAAYEHARERHEKDEAERYR